MEKSIFDRPLIPLPHADLVFQRAEKAGIDRATLFTRLGVDGPLTPQTRLSLRQVGSVLVQVLGEDDPLGYELGLATALTSHGFLGLGLMCQATVAEAIEFGLRFANLAAPHMYIENMADSPGVLQVTPRVELAQLRTPLLDYYLVALWRISTQLLVDIEKPELEIWFDFPEPDYYSAFASRLPKVKFNAVANQLHGVEKLLNHLLVSANPVSAELITHQCARQLNQLGIESTDFVSEVQAVTCMPAMGYNDLPTVAAGLNLSPRSLKRKLQQHGTTFRSVLDAARLEDAKKLLHHTSLSISVIAGRLGYTDPVNFSRAFKRMTNHSPMQYRTKP